MRVFVFLLVLVLVFVVGCAKSEDVAYERQSKAIEESDPSECEKIKEQGFFVSRDACYNLLASKTKDRSLCERIENNDIRGNCYENVG